MTANLHSALRQHQREAIFEHLSALVRDAANFGIREQEVRDYFEGELARFFLKPFKSSSKGGKA